MINLIAEIVIVALSSFIFTKRIYGLRRLSEFILTWFVLLFSQIILVELFLGSIGRFYFIDVFLFHLFILIISLTCLRKVTFTFVKPDIGPFLNSNLFILAFSIFSVYFLVKGYLNLIYPPMSADSMQYHLAFPAFWIRNGNLNNPVCIFGSAPTVFSKSIETCATSFYPINAQLFFAWIMLPLRNAFLADLGEIPFYIIGIITIFVILSKYGINGKVAILSGFLWVLIPNIFKQIKTASQIDVICATLFLLMIYTILLLKEEFNFKYSILFGISVGIFLGTKIINIVWFIAALPLFCYIFYNSSKTFKPGAVKIILMLCSVVFMVFLFGGYTYLRNFIFTGNPLFPVDLKLFGITVFKGLLDNVVYKSMIASGDKLNLGRILFKEGLGVQFLGLILPGMLIPFIFFRQIRNKLKPPLEYWLIFITPILMIILYAFFINIYVVRYLFAFVSMGLVTAVISINLIPRGVKYFYMISFICILASASGLANGGELVVSSVLSIILFTIIFLSRKSIVTFYRSRIFNKVVVSFLILGAVILSYLNVRYDKDEFKEYTLHFSKKEAWQIDIAKGWQKLNELTKNGARVAYTGRQEFYPLFGSGLKNDVKYISINGKEATPYNKFDGKFRKTKDFLSWRENLKKDKIDYLFAAKPFYDNRESDDEDKFTIEDDWAAAHPEDFRLIFSNSLSRIYKVL